MNADLTRIIEGIRQKYGRDISGYDVSFLRKSLKQRMQSTACGSLPIYAQRLETAPGEAEMLFRLLNNNHSEFFRNPLCFDLLEQVALPQLAEAAKHAGRKELRVWVAGCAAGQEAWSAAILLRELAAQQPNTLSFRLFATDISASNLEAAQRGVYPASMLQNVRWRHLREWFVAQGENYHIVSHLREGVDFLIYDLLDEATDCPPECIFGDFDLVFCCNVLFYYRRALQTRMLDKIFRSLRPGGCFVTGEVERELVQQVGGYQALSPPVAVFKTIRTDR